jgi:hypothetical protein
MGAFSRDWRPATAVVIAKKYAESSANSGIYKYVVDVTPAGGGTFRAKLKQPPLSNRVIRLDIGAEVEVLADARRQKVKFDRKKSKTTGRPVPYAKADYERALSEPPGTLSPPDPEAL